MNKRERARKDKALIKAELLAAKINKIVNKLNELHRDIGIGISDGQVIVLDVEDLITDTQQFTK